jgi:hypothetical protein
MAAEEIKIGRVATNFLSELAETSPSNASLANVVNAKSKIKGGRALTSNKNLPPVRNHHAPATPQSKLAQELAAKRKLAELQLLSDKTDKALDQLAANNNPENRDKLISAVGNEIRSRTNDLNSFGPHAVDIQRATADIAQRSFGGDLNRKNFIYNALLDARAAEAPTYLMYLDARSRNDSGASLTSKEGQELTTIAADSVTGERTTDGEDLAKNQLARLSKLIDGSAEGADGKKEARRVNGNTLAIVMQKCLPEIKVITGADVARLETALGEERIKDKAVQNAITAYQTAVDENKAVK